MRRRDYPGAALWVLAGLGLMTAALAGGDIRHFRSLMYLGVALTVVCLVGHAARALRRNPARVEDAIGARRAWNQAQENAARLDANTQRIETCERRLAAEVSRLRGAMGLMCEMAGKPVPAQLDAGDDDATQPILRLVEGA